MAQTTGDVLVEVLIDWGVDTVFGLPGDGVNGIIEAFRKKQDQIKFVLVRHEEAAAFMACAYAKFTGKLGVCLATSGPGGIHLLNGLYDAKLDGQPVLAITGMAFHDLINTHTQQDVELDKLFENVCVYNNRVMGPNHCENTVTLACRNAIARRGVAHVTIPSDVQEMKVDKGRRSQRNIAHHVSLSDTYARAMPVPDDLELRRAADVLNSGKRVAIMAGQGAIGAGDELEELANRLAAPIIKPLLGKACVPDDSPFCTGGIGLLGTRPSQEALEECDTLLMVGTSFPYIEFYPKPGQARAVQIDRDATRIGLRYPIEVGLVGDSRRTLRSLLPLIKRHEDRSFLAKAQKGMQAWNQLMMERGSRQDKPMKPQVIAQELGKRLPDNAIVACDSGTITTWWARHMPLRRGQMCSLSGNLATMACGLPYANAAAVAYPHRPVFAFVGDGGLAMLMAELSTAVKYNLNVKICVIKNNVLGQIKWEQMVFLGNPEYVVELQPIDFVGVAKACGAKGFVIDDPGDCGRILDVALEESGPVLIEAVVDSLEPPMPPRANVRQAAHFAEALARGEPNRMKIALTVMSDEVRELI